MSAAIIGSAIKFLGGQVGKKALAQQAKSFAKDKAKDFVKDKVKEKAKNFVKGKKKKNDNALTKAETYGDKSKGGALIKKPSSSLTASKSIKSSDIVKSSGQEPPKKIGFDKLTESVSNLVKITEELNLVQQEGLKFDEKRAREDSKDLQEAKRKRRERFLESGKKVLTGAVGAVGAVGKAFNLDDFLNNILLGGALVGLLNLLSGSEKLFVNLSKNLFRIYKVLPKLLKNLFDPFGIFSKTFGKLTKPFRNFLKKTGKKLFSRIKNIIGKGLRKLANGIFDFAKNIFDKLFKASTELGQEAAEKAAKNAGREAAEKAAKRTAREAAKKAGQTAAETVTEKAAKKAAETGLETAAEKAAREAAQIAAVKELRRKAFRELVIARAIQEGLKGADLKDKIDKEMLEFAVGQSGLPDEAFKATSEEAAEIITRELSGQTATNVKPKPKGFFGRIGQGLSDARTGLVDTARSAAEGFGKLTSNFLNDAKSKIYNFSGNIKNVGESFVSTLKNLDPRKFTEIAEKNIKKPILEILEKNKTYKSLTDIVKNPKTAKTVGNAAKETVENQSKTLITVLKGAKNSGLAEISGPIDKIIGIVEAILKYSFGEAPVNAIATTIGGILGYGAGFAIGSAFTGGVPSPVAFVLGVAGSIAGEMLVNKLIETLYPTIDPEQNQDPIAEMLGLPARPLIRDPSLSWEDYKKKFDMKEGLHFFGKKVNFPLGNNQEKEETGGKATQPTVQPQTVQPQSPLVGTSTKGSAKFGTSEQKKMLDAISFAEGTTKSYGTLYGGKVIPELAAGKMTIAEVLKMQKSKMYNGKSVYGSGYNSNATGRYQFMSYVLEEEINRQGISPNELFTPEMQDRLILNRISRMRGVTPELLSKEGMSDKVIDMLAPEFASFPNLIGPDSKGNVGTNTSYYGQGGKSKEEIKRAYGQSTGKVDSNKQTSSKTTTDSNEGAPIAKDQNQDSSASLETNSSSSQTTTATVAKQSPSSTSTASSSPSLQRTASYEQGAEQTVAIPLSQMQDQMPQMIPSKGKSMIIPTSALNRYYRDQLLGSLYKQG